MFEPGDIILRHRPKYKGIFKYATTRAILFFTSSWWKREGVDEYFHAEMVYDLKDKDGGWQSITLEPYKCRVEEMPSTRILVYRLKVKPLKFDLIFSKYCTEHIGMRYDFLRILWFVLNWITFGKLPRLYRYSKRGVCSGLVAGFYEEINMPCSDKEYVITSPDDIYDYCKTHINIFKEVIRK